MRTALHGLCLGLSAQLGRGRRRPLSMASAVTWPSCCGSSRVPMPECSRGTIWKEKLEPAVHERGAWKACFLLGMYLVLFIQRCFFLTTLNKARNQT